MSEKKITKKYYQSLKKKIQLFSQQYYTYDSPTISDHEFDQLKGQNNENFKKELIKVFENSREQRIKHLGTDQSKD